MMLIIDTYEWINYHMWYMYLLFAQSLPCSIYKARSKYIPTHNTTTGCGAPSPTWRRLREAGSPPAPSSVRYSGGWGCGNERTPPTWGCVNCIFRAWYRKGVGHHRLCLANTQRQAEGWESVIMSKREAFRCPLIWSFWQDESGGKLIRNLVSWVISLGSILTFSS